MITIDDANDPVIVTSSPLELPNVLLPEIETFPAKVPAFTEMSFVPSERPFTRSVKF